MNVPIIFFSVCSVLSIKQQVITGQNLIAILHSGEFYINLKFSIHASSLFGSTDMLNMAILSK